LKNENDRSSEEQKISRNLDFVASSPLASNRTRTGFLLGQRKTACDLDVESKGVERVRYSVGAHPGGTLIGKTSGKAILALLKSGDINGFAETKYGKP
jgi:hypothetical protein